MAEASGCHRYATLFTFSSSILFISVDSDSVHNDKKMPILVRSVDWYQTDDEIIIKIPKQNANARNADILISETFIKVNFQPYLFEAVLEHKICPDASMCKILENCIKFVLKKQETIHWSNFASTSQSTKSIDGIKLKTELIEENQKALAAETKERQRAKENERKANIEREMEREQKIRNQVNRIHEQVKENERKQQTSKAIGRETTSAVVCVDKTKKKAPSKPTPIRSGGTINISFTARSFVTPQRESQEHAEREWCLKQNQVKNDIGFSDDDLSADERNPKWLMEKGKEFYAQKNYLAAISAFSAGINLATCPAVLLLHRAMAQFKLENYVRSATDVSQAYDLFVPAVKLNQRDRAKCLSLRAKALKKMGYPREAESEALAALQLDSTISEWDMNE